MKPISARKASALLLALFGFTAALWATNAGTTYTNEPATVAFSFSGSTTDAATITPDGVMSVASFNSGTDFKEGSSTADGIKFATFCLEGAQTSAPGESNKLEWKVKPSAGLTFTPTRVSANIRRFGTDGGVIDVRIVNAEGNETTLATGLIPRRNNKTMATDAHAGKDKLCESFSLEVPESLATTGNLSLVCYVYSLGNTKSVGFNNVRIEGKVSGTTIDVPKYQLTAKASPAAGGTVTVYPSGQEFESGTELTLTATKNFGYEFTNWTDASGTVVSQKPRFGYTITAPTELTANFRQLNTYALSYSVDGGANDYMVQPSVKPTVVDGKNMYEEGTKVTLEALSNDIMTFTNWSTGETSAEITLTMDEDKAVVANYSATDFVAAWDFYLSGSNGRKADFAAEGNDADQLVLRNSSGTTVSWLDKSSGSGGYEGRNAGVVWQNNAAIGSYYWQIKVDATNFTNLKVKSGMAYNYNAYKVYNVEYSLNGTDWSTIGKIEMPKVKAWTDSIFVLPAAADNQKSVYLRWIADKTSAIDGSKSDYDGNAISQIYVFGTPKIHDDGTAPVLLSSIPAEGATNASANGQVVLTFDETVQLAPGAKASLSGTALQGSVAGKVITFAYANLDYATTYTFNLPANTVSDRAGNTLGKPITLTFATMNKPAVSKKLYDFVIPDNGSLREAMAAAAARTDKKERYRIFVKRGQYVVPVNDKAQVAGSDGKNYSSVTTVLSANNVSLIGEDMETTVIKNNVPYALSGGDCPIEGIGKCDLLQITGSDTYIEDITLRNGTNDGTGRNLAVQDLGNRTIYKNVSLHGYQDTWTSNNDRARYYFEDGVIRGRTDYICGKGDAFFNHVTFMNAETGGYIAVPSRPKKHGWIFSECTIRGESSSNNGNYTLGRPWGSGTPVALWINTTMISQPSAIGWGEMSGGYPKRFAEYNSMTKTGTVIDLSHRKKTFGNGYSNNPVLTAEEAAQYTIATVMGGDDNWDPQSLTEQASAPQNVTLSDTTLTWDNSNYALLWAVCKNGSVVGFTTEPQYTVDDKEASWAVRAANEMGGLGEATAVSVTDGISQAGSEAGATVVGTTYYTLGGMKVLKPTCGVNIVVSRMSDGTVRTSKIVAE